MRTPCATNIRAFRPNNPPRLTVAVVLVALAGAGCLDGSRPADGTLGPNDEALGPVPRHGADTGALEGNILTLDFRPVPGALILVDPGGRECRSDEEGRYAVSVLRPGEYTVSVAHDGYRSQTRGVVIVSDHVLHLDVVLEGVPGDDPYVNTLPFEAYIPCAVSAYQTLAPCQSINPAHHQGNPFAVGHGLTSLVVSARWDPPSSAAAVVGQDRLQFQLNAPTEGKTAVWNASSPTATWRRDWTWDEPSFNQTQGPWNVVVKPAEGTRDQAYRDGSGVVYEQHVRLWVTLAYYGYALASSYTGFPDA